MRTHAQKQNQAPIPASSSLSQLNMSAHGCIHNDHPGLSLQGAIANQAVQRMSQADVEESNAGLAGTALPCFEHDFSWIPIHFPPRGAIQAKLSISNAGNAYEQEADRVAEQVMHLLEPKIQRVPINGGGSSICPAEQFGNQHKRPQIKRVQSSDLDQSSIPAIVHDVLRSPGQPLEQITRVFMEQRFGHDFSRVRVHADQRAAHSARVLNARAYTVGRDVVFGGGQYQVHSKEGRKLIAHELTHVAQQRPAGAAFIQREAVTPDPRVTACMQQTEEILPGRVGLLVHMHREQQLVHIFGSELDAFKQLIRSNREARRFVCEAGVPAMVALSDTRSDAGLDVAAARRALNSHRERYTPQALERRPQEWRIERTRVAMTETGSWARHEVRRSGIPSMTGIVGLPAVQRANVSEAIAGLHAALPEAETIARLSGAGQSQLERAIGHLGEARRRASGEYGSLHSRASLGEAQFAVDEARDALGELADHYDVDELQNRVVSLHEAISGLYESIGRETDVDTEAIRGLRDHARQIGRDLREAQREMQGLPASVQRVLFVLRYFQALNQPGFAGAPGADEVAAHRGHLSDIGEDMRRVFGSSLMGADAEFISAVAARIDRQLQVRAAMEQELGRETALVPPRDDVEAYFRGLAAEPNEAVIRTYESFAEAYFEHQGVSSRQDLNVANLEALFARPLSITGTRGLVCTGYAILGARLLELAGANIHSYIIGVRASDQQLVSGNDLDDAHALGRVTRRGQTLFVSNDTIVFSQADGLGPDAVAWSNRANPIFTAAGATIGQANTALEQLLANEIPNAQQRLNP
jgi:hypothetical protein